MLLLLAKMDFLFRIYDSCPFCHERRDPTRDDVRRRNVVTDRSTEPEVKIAQSAMEIGMLGTSRRDMRDEQIRAGTRVGY